MIYKPFSNLYDEVMIDVGGVTTAVALNAIRKAAIEFCDLSKVWVVDADPISSIANQSVYQFEPESGTEVCGIVQAYYNGTPITTATADQLEAEFTATAAWKDVPGTPQYYTQERSDEFILTPYPETGIADAIKMLVALKPTRTATGMEAWVIDKYFEDIAAGAKAKLFKMAKKPWTDYPLADNYQKSFDRAASSVSALSAFKLPTTAISTSTI